MNRNEEIIKGDDKISPRRLAKAMRYGSSVRGLDHPELTVGSLASWWVGIRGPDDKFSLDDVSCLVFGPDSKGTLKFRAKTGCCTIELNVAKYDDSLPVSVAKTVLRVRDLLKQLQLLRLALIDQSVVTVKTVRAASGKYSDWGT